jgi:LPS export ABC transporter permease LptG
MPVVGATLFLSLFAFGIQGYVMPFSNQRASQIRDQIRGHPGRSYSQPQRKWFQGEDGTFYSFKAYQRTTPGFLRGSGDGTFQGFSVLRLDPRSYAVKQRIYAKEAHWGKDGWIFRSGWERSFTPDGGIGSFEEFKEKQVSLPLSPATFMGDVRTPDQMNYSQLKVFIADLQRRGYSVQELLIELHEKIALPFVSMVMVILGLPFAFRSGKKGSLYGIGLGIGLVVVYYAAFAVLSALGQIGLFPPFLAAWAPNILFAGFGAYMMLSVGQT